ncbi:MAG: tetratricopeptide repeat protein [Anderseniella sp.]|jgi:hypothetical protein|nr:tetratricopeptide repeat protein [Anderseniella sp.]
MSDDSLFREVDEEVRRQKIVSIWNRFGNLIVVVCVLVVVGVGGYKAWQFWQAKQAEEAGMKWFEAVRLAEAGKTAEADTAFAAIARTGTKGYAVLAELTQAARLGQDGKRDEAVAIYDKVAADAGADAALRELARVRAAYLLVDTASVDDLVKRLDGLSGGDQAWRHAAREILSLAYFRSGDYKKAADFAAQIIADPATPAGLRARMQLVSDHIEPLLPAAAN